MPTVIDEAVDYCKLGWHVLPGKDKIPFVKWSEASNDPDTVTALFEKYPKAEILVLTGPSGLGVLDVDIYKAPLEVKLPQYDTWEFETPRGGRQFVFRTTDPIPSTASKINDWTDTRGQGGLIVVPSVNSPKRRWVKRAGEPAVWPYEAFSDLGRPPARAVAHTDDIADWTPAVGQGERLPNEHCPGPMHANGDKNPSLGMWRLPNGVLDPKCFAGCPTDEVIAGLIESGKYSEDEFRPVKLVEPGLFITKRELMALRPPTWMIEPYLQENALVQLTAKFNTGKTFVAVDWACRLSSQGKKVLYIALEGLTGLQSRVTAWEEFYETDAGDILFSPRGFSLNLLSERDVLRLVDDLQSYGGFDLVVVDNLGEATPGDENDSEVIARAMHGLNSIRRAAGGCVLDLHNSGHGPSVRSRGHSKILDVHDTVVYLEAIEGSLGGLKVICGKERNAERFTTRRALLKPYADSLVAVMGGKAVAESDPVYNAVKLGHDTGNKVAQHLDMPYSTAKAAIAKLIAQGDLIENPLSGKEKRYLTAWDQPLM